MVFVWDGNGGLLTWDDGSDEWAYGYDSQNRLINVKKNDAVSARYTYDAGGRRVRSWDAAAGTTDYVYSGLNIVDEVNGGVHEKHVYAGGMHLASNCSGVIEYYHVDHLGSTRLKTNSTGGVIYESNYEPYGPGYGESGGEVFRYTGKPEDSTGLYYFGARYYDPVTGRFITRDSVFGDLSDPQSLNRYTYCRNNPHKYTDPDGKFTVPLAVAGAIVGGGMNFAFYCIKNGNKFNWRDAAATLVAGALSGAIMGATAGMINPVSTSAVANVGIQLTMSFFSNVAETGTELSFQVLSDKNMSFEEKINTVGSGMYNSLVDIGVETVMETASAGFLGENIQEVTELLGEIGKIYVSDLLSKSIEYVTTTRNPEAGPRIY